MSMPRRPRRRLKTVDAVVSGTRELTAYERTQAHIAQFNVARDFVISMVRRYQQHQNKMENRNKYFIAVSEDEDLYDKILALMVETIEPKDRRALEAFVENQYDSELEQHVYKLVLGYDGKFATSLVIDGHKVGVKITQEREDASNGALNSSSDKSNDVLSKLFGDFEVAEPARDPMEDRYSRMTWSKRVVFTCNSMEARDATVKKLEEMAAAFNQTEKRKSRFHMPNHQGYWQVRSRLQDRPLASVVLHPGAKEKVVDDLRAFLETEQRHIELGLPWHRGYLFHGPPGTGKTSFASALASEFQHDVYYLPLSSIDSDVKLQELVSNVDAERAILVLEDIDVVHAARERDDKEKGITLAGLLNTLDGIGTPHGLITIMTTNVREVLDEALVRPGRVDFELEIGYVTDAQLTGLVERFHGASLDLPPITGRITPAEVVGLFKTPMESDRLRDTLTSLIERRNAGEEPGTPINLQDSWGRPAAAGRPRRPRPSSLDSFDDAVPDVSARSRRRR